MASDLVRFLHELDMPQYYDSFVSNGFDTWDDVLDVTEADLATMGIKLGHRRRMQRRLSQQRVNRHPRNREPSAGDPLSQPKKRRKYVKHPKPDGNAPKKPLSAYALFANDKREEYKDRSWTFVELAKEIGRLWQSLDEQARSRYHARALQAKQHWQVADALYSQTEECRQYRRYLEDWKVRQSAKIQNQNAERKADGTAKHPDPQRPCSPSTVSTRRASPQSEGWHASPSTGTAATSPVLPDSWSLSLASEHMPWPAQTGEMAVDSATAAAGGAGGSCTDALQQTSYYNPPRPFENPYDPGTSSHHYAFFPALASEAAESKLAMPDLGVGGPPGGGGFMDGR